MGLKIRLKPHEKLIINGCVVENGDRRNTITVSSFAQVLKSSDILQERDAGTCLRRIYYAVQLILIDQRVRALYQRWVNSAAAKLYHVLPSQDLRVRLSEAINHLHESDYYKTLKKLKVLIEEEDKLGPLEVEGIPEFPRLDAPQANARG